MPSAIEHDQPVCLSPTPSRASACRCRAQGQPCRADDVSRWRSGAQRRTSATARNGTIRGPRRTRQWRRFWPRRRSMRGPPAADRTRSMSRTTCRSSRRRRCRRSRALGSCSGDRARRRRTGRAHRHHRPDVTVSTNLGPWVNRRGFARRGEERPVPAREDAVGLSWAFAQGTALDSASPRTTCS